MRRRREREREKREIFVSPPSLSRPVLALNGRMHTRKEKESAGCERVDSADHEEGGSRANGFRVGDEQVIPE